MVSRMYRTAFERRLGSTATLDYSAFGWHAAEVAQLCNVCRTRILWKVLDLRLSSNALGDEGTRALAAVLGEGCLSKLERLHLNHNGIRDQGAIAIGAALSSGQLRRLEAVDLGYNGIGACGLRALTESVAVATPLRVQCPCESLRHINVEGNPGCKEEAMSELADALRLKFETEHLPSWTLPQHACPVLPDAHRSCQTQAAPQPPLRHRSAPSSGRHKSGNKKLDAIVETPMEVLEME